MDKINSQFQQRNIIPFPSSPQIKLNLMISVQRQKSYSLRAPKSFKPVLVTDSKNQLSQPTLAELKKSLLFLKTQIQFKRFLFLPFSQQVVDPTLRCHWAMNSPRY